MTTMIVNAVPPGPGRISTIATPSPRDGGTSAPVNNILGPLSTHLAAIPNSRPRTPTCTPSQHGPVARASSLTNRRPRTVSQEGTSMHLWYDLSTSSAASVNGRSMSRTRQSISSTSVALAKAQSRSAQRVNDALVYLDGPQVYTCSHCRTHLASHDEIVSKSFHGRHGRAYLFDQCVNVSIGPAEDRRLMTGLHSVSDIFCQRCKGMVGWTYAKAYESSQKYKEGKFIIEKINLHMEESDYYDVRHPAGEKGDRWRKRAMSWGSESLFVSSPRTRDARSPSNELVHEYQSSGLPLVPRYWESPLSACSPAVMSSRKNTSSFCSGPPLAPMLNSAVSELER